MSVIGKIVEIWRYPVKSMQGEQLESCDLKPGGIAGDRGWAVRNEKDGEIQGAKKIPKLLLCQAKYLTEPTSEGTQAVNITLPDGTSIGSEDQRIHEALSEYLGKTVTLWPLQPAANSEHYKRKRRSDEADFRELLSREADEPLPDLSGFSPDLVEELFEFVSPIGTYFDVAPLHILTSASLEALGELLPQAKIDSRRFRPNFLIKTQEESHGFVEFQWNQKTVRVGEATITCGLPVPRCGMTTHEQPRLPKDTSILRTIVKHINQNLGIYGTPEDPGKIRNGDVVAM